MEDEDEEDEEEDEGTEATAAEACPEEEEAESETGLMLDLAPCREAEFPTLSASQHEPLSEWQSASSACSRLEHSDQSSVAQTCSDAAETAD